MHWVLWLAVRMCAENHVQIQSYSETTTKSQVSFNHFSKQQKLLDWKKKIELINLAFILLVDPNYCNSRLKFMRNYFVQIVIDLLGVSRWKEIMEVVKIFFVAMISNKKDYNSYLIFWHNFSKVDARHRDNNYYKILKRIYIHT